MMSCSDQGKENGHVIDDVAVNSSLGLRLRNVPQDEGQGEGRRKGGSPDKPSWTENALDFDLDALETSRNPFHALKLWT